MGLDMFLVGYSFEDDYKDMTDETFNEVLRFVEEKNELLYTLEEKSKTMEAICEKTRAICDLNELEEDYKVFQSEVYCPLDFEQLQNYKEHMIEEKENLYDWRKANQIHEFFRVYVKGEFACDETTDFHEVKKNNLEHLQELCEIVLEARDEDVSKEHLPTSEGFFFGSTEYDEWYYKDIENTLNVAIPKGLKALEEGKRLFYYSWY